MTAPHGTWRSPLTAARVTAGTLRFDHLVVDGADLYWIEGRASEGGRSVIVRRAPDGAIADVTPPGFNVRTRVHEYGGAAYTVHRGTVYFSNFADQRLYRQAPGSPPEPITPEGSFYSDASVDERRARLVCVREDHTGDEVQNAVVGVSLHDGAQTVLATGADFYSDPVVSPDGTRMAWLQWRHPNMPWDGTELWVAAIDDHGGAVGPVRIAGGPDESIFEPQWLPDGDLVFVSDRTGWWNLYRVPHSAMPATPGRSSDAENDGAALHVSATSAALHSCALLPMDAEFGKPLWTFSQSTYCIVDRNRIACTFNERGRWHLGMLHLDRQQFERIDALPLEPTDGVRAVGDALAFIGGSPTHPLSVALWRADAMTVVRAATEDRIPHVWISAAQAITFVSNGETVHAFYYTPVNPDVVAPPQELPPLIVVSHGGPTAASTDILDPRLQFWTSRGFAVLDVNYGGSTGFGRAYRDRLKGRWGQVDVADCVNGALHLVHEGRADPRRLIIRGGSAGGYTTLAALTFYDVFRAGASHYGVSDLEVLAHDTHKFESRYLESLVGPYPEARDVYRARSPIHFADNLAAALILFQGLEDKVVPPNQAEMMAAAVRGKGLPVAYVPFAGEQHGFRRAENIVRALESELYFYGAVFGFRPADDLAPIAIDNLAVDNRT